MKKVVAQIPETEVVTLEYLNINKYYGVLTNPGKDKGFVSKNPNTSVKPYFVGSTEGLTTGNQFGWHADTLRFLIQEILANPNIKGVYEFDTPAELFKWLAS